jgi:DNA repair exonuclease SbcCD ATPase subunit
MMNRFLISAGIRHPNSAKGWWLLAFCLAVHTWSPASPAAPKQNDAAAQALRKAQGMLRQLSEEKAALEAEKKALADEAEKLRGEVARLEPLKGLVEQYRAGLENSRSANGALQEQLQRAGTRERNLQDKLKEIVAQAKSIQNDNHLLVAAVREREKWIAQCTENNKALIAANGEMLDQYRNKGFWDKLAEVEPITGIGKVETENLAEAYQFKLQDLKVTPFETEVNAAGAGQEPVSEQARRSE